MDSFGKTEKDFEIKVVGILSEVEQAQVYGELRRDLFALEQKYNEYYRVRMHVKEK